MTLSRSLALPCLLALISQLTACGRGGEEPSVGQRVDSAMERASQAVRGLASQARPASRQEDSGSADPASSAATQASSAQAGASGATSSSGAGAVMSDTRITATVKMGLTADKDLGASSIDVDTQAGVVTLKGIAPSATAKARAGEIARHVRDVKSVDNQLSVVAGG